MHIKTLTEQLSNNYKTLCAYAKQKSLWQDNVIAVKTALEKEFTDIDDVLQIYHECQRLIQIHTAGLENNEAFYTDYQSLDAPMWKSFSQPPVDHKLQDTLAKRLYFQAPKPDQNDKAMFIIGDQARYVGQRLVQMALDDDIPFHFKVVDINFGYLVYNHVSDEGLRKLADFYIHNYSGVTKRISSSPILQDVELIEFDQGKAQIFSELTEYVKQKIFSGEIDFALTKIPSRTDAKVDGFEYEDYIKLFFEMCDQPWSHIDTAHQLLIKKLNTAKIIHIQNNDGTNIRMEMIDENGKQFTFCNSLVARNIPGSEVFSAPRRDSVNGTIVAKGKFNYFAGKIITDLTLHFKDGHLYDFDAAEGAEHFQDFLDRNPNNRYVGELGIGTNPHLKKHVLNGLLVEKIGGSFHVALGHPYTMKEYMGMPVYVDNGNNDTPDHWDITTMLIGKGGSITVDDTPIMIDGIFTDPALDVLNKGWASIPPAQRPSYWKDYKGSTLS